MTYANYSKQLNADGTAVRVGEGRFSYAYVWEPRRNEETGVEKYSCSFLIPKSNTAAIKLVESAIAAAAKKGADKYWSGKVPANIKKPLRDGDEDRPDDPVYKGMMFFNASNQNKPAVCVKDEDMGTVIEAMDRDEFYSGCWGAIICEFYAYNKNGNRGIAVSLGNVVKTRDDEPLSTTKLSVDASFGDL